VYGSWGAYVLNMRRDRNKYVLLFMIRLFCEYMNLEYIHVHVIYRVDQAEWVIRIIVAAPQEYVNTYSTRRGRCKSGYPRYLYKHIDTHLSWKEGHVYACGDG